MMEGVVDDGVVEGGGVGVEDEELELEDLGLRVVFGAGSGRGWERRRL